MDAEIIKRLDRIIELLEAAQPPKSRGSHSNLAFRIDGLEYDGHTGRPKDLSTGDLHMDRVAAAEGFRQPLDHDLWLDLVDGPGHGVPSDDEAVVHVDSPVLNVSPDSKTSDGAYG